MQKLSAQSKDLSQENIKKVEELFPNCVTETYDQDGNLVRSIDFDILRQDLSDHVVEGPKERYQFNWPGKREAILLANAPTTNTLRPLPEKSVDFENTKNVYIEGDNLEALKILRETYMGKIKMIYIDPPYNTGNDFVYKDDFKQSTEEYLKSSGDIDEEGNRMEVNGESNGRFHSDWLNMMYPRLILARDLLTDNGVIFISIDDNEVDSLKKICDEIFGINNFIGCFLWKKKSTSTNVANSLVSPQCDYQLCYGKRLLPNSLNRRETTTEQRNYPFHDGKGEYRTAIIEKKNFGTYARSTMDFPILGVKPREGKRWQIGEKTAREFEKQNRFILDNGIVKLKIYKQDDNTTFSANPSLLLDYGSTDSASKEVNVDLFKKPELFSNPKPVDLLIHFIEMGCLSTSIVLDFFSGSATTGEAVFRENIEKDKNIRFILVQLPEITDSNSEANKSGYKTICDIGEERLRLTAEKIKKENSLITEGKDLGFRTFKIDSSNMKDILSTPKETQLSLLENAESAIKPDRNPLDLITQVMLQLGITLDADIKIGKFAVGGQFYAINGNDLICCFDKDISESDIEEMARMQPMNVAFRDDSFTSDQDEVNCEQIFKTLSPITGKNIFVL